MSDVSPQGSCDGSVAAQGSCDGSVSAQVCSQVETAALSGTVVFEALLRFGSASGADYSQSDEVAFTGTQTSTQQYGIDPDGSVQFAGAVAYQKTEGDGGGGTKVVIPGAGGPFGGGES